VSVVLVRNRLTGKSKVVSMLNQARRHEGVLREQRHSSTHSLTSALNGGDWSALRPGPFIPRERAPGTRCIGGYVGPRAGLDAVEKRKSPIIGPVENRTSVAQPSHYIEFRRLLIVL
jgi:hypothetical protein